MSFTHLNLHSEYSIVDSIIRIDDLLAACVKAHMPAVAITDQSNFFSLVKFYKAAMAAGIKPIIGVDVWLYNDKEPQKPFKLVLLAQNNDGYKNLLQLVSRSYLEGKKLGRPVVSHSWVEEFSLGVIALSGGRDGDAGQALLSGELTYAQELLHEWQRIFPERYYLEVQRTGRTTDEEDYNQKALELAEILQIPVVATNAVCFLKPVDFEAHEARVCIHAGYVLEDRNRPRNYTAEQYFRTTEEMMELFVDAPSAITNTLEIAKRCNVSLELGKNLLPIFPVPDGIEMTVEEFLEQQAKLGLNKRLQKAPEILAEPAQVQVYEQRLQYELSTIKLMGFASYFLIVADFIEWAKKNGVPVGPGRGSGVGSLVAYSLGITDLDPIVHELLFERFLNPERVSMPDFDIDFCMEGRDRVIEYVIKRYGAERVAQIITYGTMAARAAVRDVGRVLGHPYGFVDKIAKLIPFELGISLEKALHDEEQLLKRYKEEDEVKILIDLAMKLEGITRNAGKHAGGVVIAPTKLTDFVPLYCEEEDSSTVTQFDKNDVEEIGLVKFDFLGLRTLTIIDWAVQTINKKRAQNGEALLDIINLPLDDPLAYKLIQDGATTAIFQLESRGIRDVIKRLQPDCFGDIGALVALYRPGPLQSGMVEDFINRKHGQAEVTYFHPSLEPILRPTYGIILYQEQVMQIAQVLAGYSLGSADLLRRAMGKKKPEEMAKQRAIFLEGATNKGVDKHLANSIFDLIDKFSGYGFNKSHSVAYALIAYQTLWLKAHYPAEFMAAVLSSDMDNTDKVVQFLGECKKLNLTVIPPDINRSEYRFTVLEGGEIMYGLGAIKGVGLAAVENITANRNEESAFKSLFDFCKRVDTRKANRRVLEALICAGAFDKLAVGAHRASMMATLDTALKVAEQHERNKNTGQLDLFASLQLEDGEGVGGCGLSEFEYVQTAEWNEEKVLQGEKSVLGFYLSGHPIDGYRDELKNFITATIGELAPEVNKNVVVAGFVAAVRVFNTRNGNKLAAVTLGDETGNIDITAFAELYLAARDLLNEGQLLVIEGEVGVDNFSGSTRIRAVKIRTLEQARADLAKGLILRLNAELIDDNKLTELATIIEPYRNGTCNIFISYNTKNVSGKLVLESKYKVKLQNEFLYKLRQLLGNDNVTVWY